jgi:hypothetical protein
MMPERLGTTQGVVCFNRIHAVGMEFFCGPKLSGGETQNQAVPQCLLGRVLISKTGWAKLCGVEPVVQPVWPQAERYIQIGTLPRYQS